jgi:starch synthase
MEVFMPRVLMVASECTPFAKSGGLGDVLGALPPALAALGWEPAVVIPRYAGIGLDATPPVYENLSFGLGPHAVSCDIFEKFHRGVRIYFVDCPWLFDRPGLYGGYDGSYWDNHLRFAALCKAALGIARHLFRTPLFHIHDWQAALVAPYLKTQLYGDPLFQSAKVVFTIHNMEHQGRFGPFTYRDMGLDAGLFHPGAIEYYGDVNLIKGAIVFSDAITTVSPRYALEIQTPEFGFGLDGLLRHHSAKLRGILNGADYSEWSPESDPHIAAPYSVKDLSGKRACKLDLLRVCGLGEDRVDKPLLGIVSRFAHQKGLEMVRAIAPELLKDGVTLVVLGNGDPELETFFSELCAALPDRVHARIGFHNELAHKIEAGADIFLMPSRFEPCGLNQIYSLRYGTIPVVRKTGGLDDTVDETTGFKFEGFDPWSLFDATRLAIAEFHQPALWQARMRRAMALNFSWDRSAAAYAELYRGLAG